MMGQVSGGAHQSDPGETGELRHAQYHVECGRPGARRGRGAHWILNEMKSYNPKLQVQFEKFRVKKQGQRIFKDVDLYNVVAYLPGRRCRRRSVVVSAHYDSLNLGTRPAGAAAGPGTDAGGGAGAGAREILRPP